jgi:hypothetical protein
MLGCFKETREDIAKYIKKSPCTEDCIYVCKNFPRLNKALGEKKDKRYTFDRKYFDDKICFTEGDLSAYLETEPSHYNVYRMRIRDLFLRNIIRTDIKRKLHKKIKDSDYTLGELIDATIFYFNYKH